VTALQTPLMTVLDAALAVLPTFDVEMPGHHGVVLETIKRGEDDKEVGEKTVILRMYEGIGGKSKGRLNM